MLSYRHVYHAGNLGDVLKHLCLLATLRASTRKATPLCYLDSHAGAGLYALRTDMPAAELHSGIGALWSRLARVESAADDALLQDYLTLVLQAQRFADATGARARDDRSRLLDMPLQLYPGSPWFAGACLRAGDRMWLAELHSTDQPLLEQAMRLHPGAVRPADVHVLHADGYAMLAANLPPRERRGVVLIDPAYELADEHDRAMRALSAALGRFAHGVYLLWAPTRGKAEPARMERDLLQLRPSKLLRVSFVPREPRAALAAALAAAPRAQPLGSIVWLINPPFKVEVQLRTTFAACADALNVDAEVRWLLGN